MAARWLRDVAAHLPFRRRSRLPTAMGLIPPVFFFPAWSLAPHMKGATIAGTLPAIIEFTSLVRFWRAGAILFGAARNILLRCSGLSPDGPGADHFLNLSTVFITSSLEKVS